MPLKRKQTKPRAKGGGRARKSMSSFPMREFKRPIPANRMTAGVRYEGWQCKNDDCHKVIAIMATASRGTSVILQDADDHIASVKCPHCGIAQEHRWNARDDLTHESTAGA